MWLQVEGPPFSVTQGSIYIFVVIVPGTMSQSDLKTWLAPAAGSSNQWGVESVHPGHVSGGYVSYQVLGTWAGASAVIGQRSSDPTVPAYASMAIWAADATQPAATPENTPDADERVDDPPSPSPPAVDAGSGWWFLGGMVLSVGGLFLLERARQEQAAPALRPRGRYPRTNPVPLAGGLAVKGALAVAAWEAAWWARRRSRRATVYEQAQRYAAELGRPLVVIGAPDGGVTSGYGCGDCTIDLVPSSCPNPLTLDITQRTPLADDSCVVFVSCVLEYVSDHNAALAEIQRISGGHAFFVGVEPWTVTAALYPGAKRTLPARYR